MKWWEDFGQLGVAGKTRVQTSRSQSHSVGERERGQEVKAQKEFSSTELQNFSLRFVEPGERERGLGMPSIDWQPWPVVSVILNVLENSLELEKVWKWGVGMWASEMERTCKGDEEAWRSECSRATKDQKWKWAFRLEKGSRSSLQISQITAFLPLLSLNSIFTCT